MVPDHGEILKAFFKANEHEYNFESKEECGRYTENALLYLREVTFDERYKHLRKYGSSTQYNGHAIDVLAYDNRGLDGGSEIMEIDILKDAESSEANHSWQVRNTPYKPKDLMEPEEIGVPVPGNTVPWVGYNEQGFEALKRQLSYDYSRRPQGADFDVTVWAARVFHSTYMGPDRIPLGFDAAMKKHRPEWCSALGVPVDDHWEV